MMHPKPLSLQLFALKSFGAAGSRQVERHVENCVACTAEVDQYRAEFQPIRATLRDSGMWAGPDASIWIVNRRAEAGYYFVGTDGWETSGLTPDKQAAINVTLALYAKRRREANSPAEMRENRELAESVCAA
jgi:hypothetical protein